jgi:hypothetical protein
MRLESILPPKPFQAEYEGPIPFTHSNPSQIFPEIPVVGYFIDLIARARGRQYQTKRPTKRPTFSLSSPDYLTRRNGNWHFVRRVPIEFATFDRRGVVKHSTRIKVTTDRGGRRASDRQTSSTNNSKYSGRHCPTAAEGAAQQLRSR